MSILQIIVVITCLLFVVFAIRQVSSKKLLLRYSLLWLGLAAVVILVALFPQPVFIIAGWLGFGVSSNFIFFVALFFLLAIVLSLSVIVSKQSLRLKNTVQNLALLEKRFEELEEQPWKIRGKEL